MGYEVEKTDEQWRAAASQLVERGLLELLLRQARALVEAKFVMALQRPRDLMQARAKLLANGDQWETAIAANLQADAAYR